MRDRFKRYRVTILLGSVRLRKLVAKREKLNLEIERVSELITANANFLPDEQKADQLLQLEQLVADPPGFTDSVRKVLRGKPRKSRYGDRRPGDAGKGGIQFERLQQSAGFDPHHFEAAGGAW